WLRGMQNGRGASAGGARPMTTGSNQPRINVDRKPLWCEAAIVTNPGLHGRLRAIGAVMLSVAGAFAYTGGWLSPVRLTQDRMIAAFRDANGTNVGFRRNHANGVCVTGWFESSGQAAAISKAAVFKTGRVPV